MRNTTLAVWLLPLLALGCQPSAPAETPPIASPPRVPPRLPAVAIDTLHVVSEAVVGELFKALTYEKLRPLLKNYTKKVALASATDDGALPDSTVTYSSEANSFVFRQSGGAAVLLRCLVKSQPRVLTTSLHLGMSRAELGKAVAHSFVADVLRVSEEEGYQNFYFVLKNDVLQAVRFESDYLD